MSENKLCELIETVNKIAYQHGHILEDWKTRGSHHSGFYYGALSHTNGYTHCELCKQTFAVDSYKELDIKFSQCVMNPKGYLKKDDSVDGYAVVTWSTCYLCGRPLHSRPAMLRGTCSNGGCAHVGKGDYPHPKEKIEKNNRFYLLSKLPKENNKGLPVLSYVLVDLKDGVMKCSMAQLGNDGFVWITFEFNNITGYCYTCAPRDTLVDLLQDINSDDFEISQDTSFQTMTIKGKQFKNTLKCIDAQEFPLEAF